MKSKFGILSKDIFHSLLNKKNKKIFNLMMLSEKVNNIKSPLP